MIKTLLLSCIVLLFTWQISAQSLVTVYEGSSVPTEQGWTELKLDNTVNSVAAPTSLTSESGVLRITSTNAADQFSQLGWYKTGLDLSLSKGYTIEIKAKVTTADKTGAFNIQGLDKDGKGFRIGILNNAITEQTNPLAATNLIKDGLTNDDNFHVYRLVFASTGIVSVYRNGSPIGNFPISTFQFDNIIENGGFEDGENPTDPTTFPDFSTNAIMYRDNSNNSKTTGNWGLIIDNDNKAGLEANERARIREIAVKPGTKYSYAFSRHRINEEPWAWRDLGYFYNHQDGTQNGVDNRDPNVSWGSAYETNWLRHTAHFIPTVNDKTIRVEFPSWIRDGSNTRNVNAIDDVYFVEDLGLQVGPKIDVAHAVFESVPLPANIDEINLIKNGSFENYEMNNDGSVYTWALSNEDNNNEPVGENPLWNGFVRIQKNDKPDDKVGGKWAHSGSSSLRFSTLGGSHKSISFTINLEANKAYRFSFWHRNPVWPESGKFMVKVGDTNIWSNIFGGQENSHNAWINTDLVFKTTEESKSVTLYTQEFGGWYNVYLDDFALYEIQPEELAAFALDPALTGKTNLIANGDFEDVTKDNNGNDYTWALATDDDKGAGDNYPVAWSDVWGTYVRLQNQAKGGDDDTGASWAHSGTNSLRISYLDDMGKAKIFEGITNDDRPNAYKTNINFVKELEANKTYTLVFWVKTSNYNDRGRFVIANGDSRIWEQELSRTYNDWSRQSVTFSTTTFNHTLKMFTEFGSWFNFYLDDIFLYEEETYVPNEGGDTFLFFGKSTGTSTTDVEVAYVKVDDTGAYAPEDPETGLETIASETNVRVHSKQNALVVETKTPAVVSIYNTVGMLVANVKVENSKTFDLPAGSYIIKSVSENGKVESVKALNR